MIDIKPPILAPQIGINATLEAAAPNAVTNTMLVSAKFRRHESETRVAKKTDGNKK
jgi:hypothetical protein